MAPFNNLQSFHCLVPERIKPPPPGRCVLARESSWQWKRGWDAGWSDNPYWPWLVLVFHLPLLVGVEFQVRGLFLNLVWYEIFLLTLSPTKHIFVLSNYLRKLVWLVLSPRPRRLNITCWQSEVLWFQAMVGRVLSCSWLLASFLQLSTDKQMKQQVHIFNEWR